MPSIWFFYWVAFIIAALVVALIVRHYKAMYEQGILEVEARLDRESNQRHLIKIENERKLRVALESNLGGFVYVIKECGLNKYYKIGMTRALIARLSHLETAMPYAMEIIAIIPTSDCEGLEQRLHRQYGKLRRKLEWFELKPEHIQDIERIGQEWFL